MPTTASSPLICCVTPATGQGRSPDSCAAHGGFYLGSLGGSAARLAQDCIKHVEVLQYPELGMAAVWRTEVTDFPAFVVVDDKGNDFFTDCVTGGPTLLQLQRP